MALGKGKNKANPWNTGPVQYVVTTFATQVSNTVTATVTVKDVYKRAIKQSVHVKGYLATLATGQVLAAAPGGGIAAGAAGLLIEEVADRRFTLVTNTSGVGNIVFTNTGAYTCFIVWCMPDGTIQVSGQLTIV